jgi:serine/threonine-protein kinase
MGAVYRARDTRLNLPVALKEMVPQPGLDPRTLDQLRRQFHQEATTLARLSHPNLVRVTDFFEEGGNAYLVMGFVEGDSLATRIARDGALPETEVLAWADQLLDALSYCHANGVIHRDVKPQNVIIGPDGQAVLVDFGLVKLWNPNDPRTRTAMRGMGTPEYAPPEQYDAQAAHTDTRSDVYGVGATLYHALTGRVPPTATQRVVDPTSLHTVRSSNPNVSRAVEAILMRAIELRPDDRFPSAEAMRQALHTNRPTGKARRAGAPRSRPSHGRRSTGGARQVDRALPPWMFGGLGIALIIVGVILVGSLAAGAIWLFDQRTSGTGSATETATSTPEPTTDATTPVSRSVTPHTPTTAAAGPTTTYTPEPTDAASPSPSLTDTPTTTPSPPAPTSTSTPTPTPSWTPTPACAPVTGPFAALWQELTSRLGCAVNEAHITWVAEQTFEGGHMQWRKDRDSVYALYGTGAWGGYPNSWKEGDPTYSCPTTAPEESPPTPLRGFGKVWCSFPEVRNGLSWATDSERGFDGTVQDFDTGAIVRNDFGVIVVLFGDGTWEQR